MSARRFPFDWSLWWFAGYVILAYKLDGWEGAIGRPLAAFVVVGLYWLAWRGWVWISSRWKIVRVA